MCEFCITHGEGKKWYEVMENYSKELLATHDRQAYIKHFVPNIRKNAPGNMAKLNWAKKKIPFAYRFIQEIIELRVKKVHFGQVVPLEDAENILDMVQSITRIACVCRNVTTGKNNARYCLVLGIDPTGMIDDWPESKDSLETLTHAEAKKALRDFDKEGLIHSIWTFKTPFIGAICNCDHDCLAYKYQISSNLVKVMFKAEYMAHIEPSTCVGCRNCQRMCHFGAVEYSTADAKCYINTLKCYGCGVCRSGCKKDAVSLFEKEGLPQSKGLW